MKNLLTISLLLILIGGACKADKVHIKDASGHYWLDIGNGSYHCNLIKENDSLYSVCIFPLLTSIDSCVKNDSWYLIFSTEKGKAHGRIRNINGCGESVIDSFNVVIEYKNDGKDILRFYGQTHGYCCENWGSLGQPEPNKYTPCSEFIEFWKIY